MLFNYMYLTPISSSIPIRETIMKECIRRAAHASTLLMQLHEITESSGDVRHSTICVSQLSSLHTTHTCTPHTHAHHTHAHLHTTTATHTCTPHTHAHHTHAHLHTTTATHTCTPHTHTLHTCTHTHIERTEVDCKTDQ